ncbi:hypothetical protein L7F22_040703 [Adiantum nelumboides]|nr:hypothetical protein [Adiantum nelumboides]
MNRGDALDKGACFVGCSLGGTVIAEWRSLYVFKEVFSPVQRERQNHCGYNCSLKLSKAGQNASYLSCEPYSQYFWNNSKLHFSPLLVWPLFLCKVFNQADARVLSVFFIWNSSTTDSGGPKKWRCNYCGMEKTGSVTRVKDHLACIPNKDIGPCANVPADVKASLETWRRTRLGLGMHEESSQHGGDEIDVCEASHVGT